MKAGRELDAFVAEKVMEYHRWSGDGDYEGPMPCFCDWGDGMLAVYTDDVSGDVDHYFSPSTDIAAAWEVFCKFTSRYLWYDDATDIWHCHLDSTRRVMEDCRYHAVADEAPLAICLASLKLYGIDGMCQKSGMVLGMGEKTEGNASH